MGLRAQDPVPDWISHLAVIKDNQVITGPKDKVLTLAVAKAPKSGSEERKVQIHPEQMGNKKVLVELKNVSVSYNDRKANDFVFIFNTKLIISVQVLKNIHWTIRGGDRFHLQGSNGKPQ